MEWRKIIYTGRGWKVKIRKERLSID